MGNFGRDDNRGGRPPAQRAYGSESFSRGGFNRGGGRGGFGGGRSSFGGGRGGFGRSDDRGPREMFKTTCSNCGKDCEVPFRPTNGKPVYCSDCFEKMGNQPSSFRPQTQFQAQPAISNNAQLEALNTKLDKIISLLENKSAEPKKVEEKKTIEEVKEVVAPKVKKVTKKASVEK